MIVNNISVRVLPLGMLLAALLLPGVAAAQKIGYVASQAIFDNLPDSKAARTKLSEVQSGWMREIDRMEKEAKKLSGEIENNRLIWSAQEKRDAEARLADLTAKLAEFRTSKYGPNGEFEQQQSQLMGPIYDKIFKAINDEARSQKIDFVFDKSSRGLPMLYANPQYDLTISVLKRLGVDVDSSAMAPGAPPPGSAQTQEESVRNRGHREDPGGGVNIDPNKLLKGEPLEIDLKNALPLGGSESEKTTEGESKSTDPPKTTEPKDPK